MVLLAVEDTLLVCDEGLCHLLAVGVSGHMKWVNDSAFMALREARNSYRPVKRLGLCGFIRPTVIAFSRGHVAFSGAVAGISHLYPEDIESEAMNNVSLCSVSALTAIIIEPIYVILAGVAI